MRLIFVSMLAIFALLSTVKAAEYHLFFLAGQSNMDGYGLVNELPDELKMAQDVMVFHGNGVFANQEGGGLGIWSKLQPGHGTGFKSDGMKNQYSKSFGSELTFAHDITKAFPNKNIAFIKYAVGGTGLALKTGYGNWSPDFKEGAGQNQYDFALNTIRNAFSVRDIDGDGEEDTLIPVGIIWMQGEADAQASSSSANAYFANLTRIMGLFRAALRKDDIPVVIGKITDSGLGDEPLMPFIDTVHKAQQKFVEQDVCAAYMTATEGYPYGDDAWHYLSEGFIRMGRDFAKAYINLAEQCG